MRPRKQSRGRKAASNPLALRARVQDAAPDEAGESITFPSEFQAMRNKEREHIRRSLLLLMGAPVPNQARIRESLRALPRKGIDAARYPRLPRGRPHPEVRGSREGSV